MVNEKVEWATCEEVCSAFEVSITTVYRAVDRNDIPHVRIGKAIRIPRRWLDGELDRFRTGRTAGEQSQQALIEEGRRVMRAVAAAERAGVLA